MVLEEEKEILTARLSEFYSKNIINLEEYESALESLNKTENIRELTLVQKTIDLLDNSVNYRTSVINKNNTASREKYLSMFSWRSSTVKPSNGNGGKFISLFGANRIIVDSLPKGTTVINVNSIFGLTEIIVSKNIRITNKAVPVFSGIFAPFETMPDNEDLPELYITGKAVFGNITIRRV